MYPSSDIDAIKASVAAEKVLARVLELGGKAPPGYQPDKIFHNHERRLPPGHYREYDVYPLGKHRRRRAERIVIEENTGRAYYTVDHYRSFRRLDG